MITLNTAHTHTHTQPQISNWKQSTLTRERETDVHAPIGI